MSGLRSRSKGQRGERLVADAITELTGWPVKRKVRQHDGDSDLEGVPGWSIEIKNHEQATVGKVAEWWAQAVEQANGKLPLLVYKRQRATWRAVWPIAVQMTEQRADYWQGVEWTAETTLEAWAAVARELVRES